MCVARVHNQLSCIKNHLAKKKKKNHLAVGVKEQFLILNAQENLLLDTLSIVHVKDVQG